MFTGIYNIMDGNGTTCFDGTYWECNEWLEMYCESVSEFDGDTLEEYETFFYRGERVYFQKKEG